MEKTPICKHLFSVLNKFDYALIFYNLIEHIEINHNSIINIILQQKDFDRAITLLKKDDSISGIKYFPNYSLTKARIEMKDKQLVQVNFIHQFIDNSIVYMNMDDVLNNRVLMSNGVFVPRLELLFEYTVLSRFLNDNKLTEIEYQFFNDYHILVQEDLLEYFNLKFHTRFREMSDLMIFSLSQKQLMLKELKGQSANQFINTINIRWHNFLGSVRQARMI